jgi:biopolymer transport protein ExbB
LPIISYNFFTSKIDDLTYSIDEAAVSIVKYRRFRGSLEAIIILIFISIKN